MADNYLTLKQLGKLLGRSDRWIRDRKHKIPHFRLGNSLRFRESEIHEWMESFRVVGEDPDDIIYRNFMRDFGRKINGSGSQSEVH